MQKLRLIHVALFVFGLAGIFAFQNCSKSTFSAASSGTSGDDNGLLGAGGCRFTGGVVANGDRVWAYQNSGVAVGSQCVVEERVCNNGALSGSFNFNTCTVGAPAACIFNNKQIEHGQAVEAFETSSVAFGSQCAKQARRCHNGTLDGTFEFGSCTPGQPLSCLFNGSQIAHNGPAVVAFQTSTVPFGQQCAQQSRSCSNGFLSGSYQFKECTPGAPASCLLNGQTIPHDGFSGDYFTTATVPFGSTCPAAMKRKCTNGTLSNPTAIHSRCDTLPQPQCPDGKVFSLTSMSCESCGAGQTFSVSQKRCVTGCNGGVVLRMRFTDTTTIETAQNPIGYNYVSGITLARNGIDHVVGGPSGTTTLRDGLNLAVSQNTQYNGVRAAYQAAMNEVSGLGTISVTLGNSFSSLIYVGNTALDLPGQDVVISGTGIFEVKNYQTSGGAPGSHNFMKIAYCK